MTASQWVFSAALLVAAMDVSARDIVWVATVSPDSRSSIDIIDATESGCLAQVAAHRQAVAVEPCQMVQSVAITDPNDANKRARTRPRR